MSATRLLKFLLLFQIILLIIGCGVVNKTTDSNYGKIAIKFVATSTINHQSSPGFGLNLIYLEFPEDKSVNANHFFFTKNFEFSHELTVEQISNTQQKRADETFIFFVNSANQGEELTGAVYVDNRLIMQKTTTSNLLNSTNFISIQIHPSGDSYFIKDTYGNIL